ncbi:MAG: HAD-IIIA family hydrolase [bacterium]|nr:HAD-IIIA family hydrolase [bacterium]MDZ4296313.1 HAD-IIIA family hydrolase [Patescibacteria group bacterium]
MSVIRQAVILAGGRGTRLRPLTDTLPKAMVRLNDRPFLAYLVDLLKANGIKEVLLLLGYLPEPVMEYFGDGSRWGLSIRYAVTPVEDDTGTRLRKALSDLDDRFLLLYCDNYWPLQLGELEAFYERQGVPGMVTVYADPEGHAKNNIAVDERGLVRRYDASRTLPGLNGVEIGFYLLEKRLFALAPSGDFSLEKDLLPRWIARGLVAGYCTRHRYYSIGSLERLPVTEEFLRFKKAVLLDRDGVINVKPPRGEYVRNWSEFQFIPGAIEALQRLAAGDYRIFVISNQAGIARGVMSEKDLQDIHDRMGEELRKHGVRIAGLYYCPHGWDGAGKPFEFSSPEQREGRAQRADDRRENGCNCRKPKPGMLFRAAAEQRLDLTRAIFVGDDERDRLAGEAAGCRTVLVGDGKGLLDVVDDILGYEAIYHRSDGVYRASGAGETRKRGA